MKKVLYPIRSICLMLALLCLLTSCSSIYEHMPDTTEPENPIDTSAEYFTTGDIVSFGVSNVGIAYEGQWIYVERSKTPVKKDNPDTPYDDAVYERLERLVKYNPVTNTVSSLCLDPNCMHSSDECLFCAPNAWMVSYFEIFGDWIMYSFVYPWSDDPDNLDVSRHYLYNLKTGEMRQLEANGKEGNIVNRLTMRYLMNGKIYTTMLELDYTGQEEHEALGTPEEFIPETHQYVEVYDPATQKSERLGEIPVDMRVICITNKRLFLMSSDDAYYSSDYNGENMKEEKKLRTYMIQLCGQYAYLIENVDYTQLGFNHRAYDLESDSIVNINYGCQVRSIMVDAGRTVYTTFDKIDEFHAFTRNSNDYIDEMYPDVTDPERRAKIKNQIANSYQYDGKFQVYITDALGNNKQLIFEGENMNIKPYRLAGNYLFGIVSYLDTETNKVIYPGDEGRCSLNIETGEITLIPQLEVILDN